ncbi:MAG: hypothetical protein AAB177_14425 [Nitrospirota bacterium]
MDTRIKILDVTGPYREPREQVFSYDYSVQRASWPTAQAVRVKVAIPEELDVLRSKILGAIAGTPGQQLMISKYLSRHIADKKFRIAEADGMLTERRDTASFHSPVHWSTYSHDSMPGRLSNKKRCGRKSKSWLDCSNCVTARQARKARCKSKFLPCLACLTRPA